MLRQFICNYSTVVKKPIKPVSKFASKYAKPLSSTVSLSNGTSTTAETPSPTSVAPNEGSSNSGSSTSNSTKEPAVPAYLKPKAAPLPVIEPGQRSFSEMFPKNLQDLPASEEFTSNGIDWSTSYHGMGTTTLSQQQIDILLLPLEADDIEIKPDGLIYLPEIKYRRILNRALGPGAWGMIPRSDTIITSNLITREYALVVMGKMVSVARGEQQYFSPLGIPTATEGCKSNALMRCCKDLGIGSELWDPRFIRRFKKQYCEDKFATHVTTGKKKKIWKRKDDSIEYPYKF